MSSDKTRPDKAPTHPSKLYYSISEVAKITLVKAHVLRYWETEFSTLRPRKTRNGSRRYRKGDIEEIFAIKTLLYDEGFKIAGARKVRLDARKKAREAASEAPSQMDLGFGAAAPDERMLLVMKELREILAIIRELGLEKGVKPANQASPPPLKQMKAQG